MRKLGYLWTIIYNIYIIKYINIINGEGILVDSSTLFFSKFDIILIIFYRP